MKRILPVMVKLFPGIFLVLLSSIALAQPARAPHPIVLGPGDTAAFPHAPDAFDMRRQNIQHGKTDTIRYFSTSVGNKLKMLVYTPPGYSAEKNYPVLFLMYGIGGDEKEWYKYTAP